MRPPSATVKVSPNDELDVRSVGEGPAVVLIHGAFFGSLLGPLAERVAAKGYRAVWYRRRGYNGTPTRRVTVPEQGADVVKVLDALRIDKAHVVGHSAGGIFALAAALDAPDRVLSVALFDSLLTQVESAKMLEQLAAPAVAKAKAGDVEGAAAVVLAGLGCTKELMDRAQPGAWSDLARDAPTWFEADVPALHSWAPDAAKVRASTMPIAWMETVPFPPIHETGELLKEWRPDLTVLGAPVAHHFFPITAPEATATVVAAWIEGQRRAV